MPQLGSPCVVTSQLQLLVIWAVVLSTIVLAWPLFSRLSGRMKKIAAVPVLFVAMVLGMPGSAFATIPTPETCYWWQALGTPCWILQAMWCPCDGGPPPPPPPPQG